MGIESRERRKFIPAPYKDRARQVDSAILKMWDNKSEAWTTYRDIVTKSKEVGIPKYTVVRALERLVREDRLEKKAEGRTKQYRPRMKPPEFNTFEYLEMLRSRTTDRKMVYDWDVGGGITHLARGSLIGFPDLDTFEHHKLAEYALNILLVRVSEIYEAIMDLRDIFLMTSAGVPVPLTDHLVREIVLGEFVRSINYEDRSTGELLQRLAPFLKELEEPMRRLYNQSESVKDDPLSVSGGYMSLQLEHSFHSLIREKKYLKSEGIDIDKFTLAELGQKVRTAHERTERYTNEAWKKGKYRDDGMLRSVRVPDELSHDEAVISRAYATKVGQLFSTYGLNEMQDMALVVTRSPNTMDTQVTTEHILYDFIQGAKDYSKKKIEGLSQEERARFLGSEFGSVYCRISPEEVDQLREQPWMQKEFGTHVETFLKQYHSARTREIEKRSKLRF
jgi:hypothetical protein